MEMFDRRERRHFRLLVAIIAIAAIFDAVSIIAVLPFLQVLSTPEILEGSGWVAWIYTRSGAEDALAFARLVGLAAVALIVVAMVFRIATIYVMTRFGMRRSYTISTRLMAGYLGQPYSWFLSRNTSDLSKTALTEAQLSVSNSLLPALRVIQAGVTTALTVVLLVAVEPVVALCAMGLIGSAYGIVYLLLREPLRRSGERLVSANKRRFHLAYEVFGAVKVIKFSRLERGVSARYATASEDHARELTFTIVAGLLPRYLLEGIAFSGLVIAIMILMDRTPGGIVELVPMFGLLVLAMARLFPALQQIYQQSATIRSNDATLRLVHHQLTAFGAPDTRGLADPVSLPVPLVVRAEIRLEGIGYTYPAADKPGLSDLSLTIPAGARIGIVGGTGAGKTTLLDVLLGLLHPAAGQIVVDGVAIGPDDLARWQAAIGYVPQDIALWDSSIRENIAFAQPIGNIDQGRVEAAARLARLHDFVMEQLSEGYDTVVGDRGIRLSGGQRQRIGIARALYAQPQVLIFDEATSALDTITERSVMAAIEDLPEEVTVIMVAHRLSTVQSCDCIFLLDNGRLVAQGTYDELIASNDIFRAMAASD